MAEPELDPELDPRCGTYAGWNVHVRLHEKICPACRAAAAAYQRAYRERFPEPVAAAKIQQRTREKALRVLARRHPEELATIVTALRQGARR